MNNKDAYTLLKASSSIRTASGELVRSFELPDSELDSIRKTFSDLKSTRDSYHKKNDLTTWEELLFYSSLIQHYAKKRISGDQIIFEADLSKYIRKPLSQLTLNGLRVRLAPLLNLINELAFKEEVNSKTIISYALQFFSNETHDQSISSFCREVISNGTFGNTGQRLSIEKTTFLLDHLEIGKLKYIELKRLKEDNVILPAYKYVAVYTSEIILGNEIQYPRNSEQVIIGVNISYHILLNQTVLRLFYTLTNLNNFQFPLTLRLFDELDGSGSHQICNQLLTITHLQSNNFLLFASKLLSIKNHLDRDSGLTQYPTHISKLDW